MRSKAIAASAAVCAALALVACGSSESGGVDLDVSAASSLKAPLTELAKRDTGATLRTEFTGSDRIAAAIAAGRLPDVVVLAGSALPAKLRREGKISKPVAIAGNSLVVAVPAKSKKVRSIEDLGRPGVTVALGSPSVPVGSYADRVISKLPAGVRSGIEANTRTREPDASGVVGKLAAGAVDAAIVYRTDVLASNGKLRAIAIPARLSPTVVYEAATVLGTMHPTEAERLVASLQGGQGQRILREEGFLPPPAPGS